MNLGMRLVTFAIMVGMPLAAAKKRDWQFGKVVEAGKEARSEVIDSTIARSADGTVRSRPRESVWDEYTYVISAGDRRYTVVSTQDRSALSILVPWGKAVRLSLGAEVEFAIEKDAMYVKDTDGKERKLRVLRVALLE